MSLLIDHFCLGARNQYETAARLRERTGLETYDGGWFPNSGMSNRLVPLKPWMQYIEVESVIDHDAAGSSPLGSWFERVTRQDALVGWTLRVDSLAELEAIGERLQLPVIHRPVVRLRPDGYSLQLHAVADTAVVWPQALPNFIFWEDQDQHPGLVEVVHRGVDPLGIAWLEVGGDEGHLRDWIGPGVENLPLRYVGGAAGIRAAAIAVRNQPEIVIRP